MTTVDFTTGATASHAPFETHSAVAVGGAEDFPNGQAHLAPHSCGAVGEHNPPAPAIPDASPKRDALGLASTDLPDGQRRPETQSGLAVGGHKQPAPATVAAKPSVCSPVLAPTPAWTAASAVLGLCADILDDVESIRTATENRLRQITRTEVDKDGVQRGFGLSAGHPQIEQIALSLRRLKHDSNVLKELGYPIRIVRDYDENGKPIGRACICMECNAIRDLSRSLREHPLGPWVAANPGIGEKQAARLISTVRSPHWNDLHQRPRTVSELWAYCGYKPGARRQKGQKANWSTEAKTRAYLVALSCMKNLKSPWREVYLKRKDATEGRLHTEPCKPCGGDSGALDAGTPWRDGHRHQDALRFTAKQILKALWLESKRLHETT